MSIKIFKVLHHRESKNVYVFDVKLYTRNSDGSRHVVAEGRASVNIEKKHGQCSVFGENYTPTKEEINQIVTVCLQRAESLKKEVFGKE